MHTGDWVALAIGLLHAAIAIAAAVYIAGNRKPSSAIAWIMAIVFIPYVGILFFLLIGNWAPPAPPRQAGARSQDLSRADRGPAPGEPPGQVAGLAADPGRPQPQPRCPPDGRQQHRRAAAGLPRLDPGDGRRDRQAKSYVYVEFFILVDDETTKPIFDAVGRACDRGVTVKVLSDHIAQFSYPNRKGTVARLREMGAEYLPMLPLCRSRALAAARPAQPPQARGRRRHGRFTGSQNLIVALPPEEEHQARPALAGADGAGRGPGRPRDRGGLRHRLVQRDRRPALPEAVAASRPARSTRPSWTRRWCPAVRASTTTTTSSCSPP